jgi:formate C-acetyltransferase
MQRFREKLQKAIPSICVERAQITTEVYRMHIDQPMLLRRALQYKSILEDMSVFIEPETLLAGNYASSNRAAPIFPEYAMDWVVAELDKSEKQKQDWFSITEKNKAVLREIALFWEHTSIKDRILESAPASVRLFHDLGLIQAEGVTDSGSFQAAADYSLMLSKGLGDYQVRAKKKLAGLDLKDERNGSKSYFYRAVIIVIDAIAAFARRYAVLAHNLGTREKNKTRRAELEEISRILNKVPYRPAETFHEAVQSLWLVHLCLQLESNCRAFSYGRMDQYLYLFYERDINAGILTDEQACELLANLWLKTYSLNTIRSSGYAAFFTKNSTYQNVTIAGQRADGRDGVNSLSYLILKSVAQVNLSQPNLTVRYHKELDRNFMQKCIDALYMTCGMISFCHDDIIIPSFKNKGVTPEDAYTYCAVGCMEAAIPGKWEYRRTSIGFIDFSKSLRLALNNPKHPLYTRSDGDLWGKNIQYCVQQGALLDIAAEAALKQDICDILYSALSEKGIEQGLAIKENEGVYRFISDFHGKPAYLEEYAVTRYPLEDKNPSADADSFLKKIFFKKKAEKVIPKKAENPAHLIQKVYNIYFEEMKKHRRNAQYETMVGVYYSPFEQTFKPPLPEACGGDLLEWTLPLHLLESYEERQNLISRIRGFQPQWFHLRFRAEVGAPDYSVEAGYCGFFRAPAPALALPAPPYTASSL